MKHSNGTQIVLFAVRTSSLLQLANLNRPEQTFPNRILLDKESVYVEASLRSLTNPAWLLVAGCRFQVEDRRDSPTSSLWRSSSWASDCCVDCLACQLK